MRSEEKAWTLTLYGMPCTAELQGWWPSTAGQVFLEVFRPDAQDRVPEALAGTAANRHRKRRAVLVHPLPGDEAHRGDRRRGDGIEHGPVRRLQPEIDDPGGGREQEDRRRAIGLGDRERHTEVVPGIRLPAWVDDDLGVRHAGLDLREVLLQPQVVVAARLPVRVDSRPCC